MQTSQPAVARGGPSNPMWRLLAPIVEAKVDALLLGCTHYPFLARTIADVLGPDVVLVSSADETAFSLMRAVGSVDAVEMTERRGTHTFVSSGDVATFARLGRQLLGPELDTVVAHRWSDS